MKPVCKFKENANIEKIHTNTIILETCIVLVNAVTLGSQSTMYIKTTRKQMKVNQEPDSLVITQDTYVDVKRYSALLPQEVLSEIFNNKPNTSA